MVLCHHQVIPASVILVLVAAVRGQLCPNNTCECHSIINVITCSDRQLERVPYFGEAFRQVWEILWMDGNDMRGINPAGAFTNLTDLKTLHLSENKLTSLKGGDFTGLEKVRDIQLDRNEISYIEPGTFSSVRSIILDINLSFNEIVVVTDGVFSGLSNLFNLNLANNKIAYIDSRDAFHGMGNLHNLDLSNNLITSCAIVNSPFYHLDFVSTLNLANNDLDQIREPMFPGLASDLENTKMLKINLADNKIRFIDAPFRSQKLELQLDGNNITTIHTWISLVKEQILRNATTNDLDTPSQREVSLIGNSFISCNLRDILNELFTKVTFADGFTCKSGVDSASDVLLMEAAPLVYCHAATPATSQTGLITLTTLTYLLHVWHLYTHI